MTLITPKPAPAGYVSWVVFQDFWESRTARVAVVYTRVYSVYMPRRNVYLPQDLDDAAVELELPLSQLLQDAIRDRLKPAKPVKKPTKRATKKVGGFATFSTPRSTPTATRAAVPPQTASEEEIEAYLDDARQAAKNGLSVEEYREILLNADPAGHVWGS